MKKVIIMGIVKKMLFNYIKRAFYKPNWNLAVRESNEIEFSYAALETKKEYNAYMPEGNYWCADPFIIREGDSIYVFCECCRNGDNKGNIAVSEYKNDAISGMRIIVEQDYHMSYPCVFKYGFAYYMIPETADNRTIELYRARRFPYEWDLIKILKKNIRCVDSTVFIKDDEIYVIVYILGKKKNKICLFQLDLENETLKLSDEFEDDGTGRPAGNIVFIGNRLFRPTQVSIRKYGESIDFKEISLVRNNAYREKAFFKLQGSDILIKGEKKVDRIHTFNRVGNMEIIDYSHDTFELVRPVKLVIRKLTQLLN